MINQFARVIEEGNVVLARDAPRPQGVRVILRPNRYDPGRAHLVVLDWQKKSEVEADLSGFLKVGESYRLMDPRDVFGKPVQAGTADGSSIRVRMAGEFAAFVLIRTARARAGR
jgi:hypothetical protein